MEDTLNKLLNEHLLLSNKIKLYNEEIKKSNIELNLKIKLIKSLFEKDDSLIFHEIIDNDVLSEHWKDIRSTLYDLNVSEIKNFKTEDEINSLFHNNFEKLIDGELLKTIELSTLSIEKFDNFFKNENNLRLLEEFKKLI